MSDAMNQPSILVVAPRAGSSASWQRYLLAGELPFLAVGILVIGAFLAGQYTAPQRARVAVAEKGAIVLETLLAHPGASGADVDALLRRPILAVFQKYADQGYTVLDASKDEAGNLAVVALPAGALDFTAELRQAVRQAAAPAALPASSSSAQPSRETVQPSQTGGPRE